MSWTNFEVSGPLPGVFEDILFCVDLNNEMDEPWGENEQNSSRIQVLQRTLDFFVKHKNMFDKRHRFGICTMTDSVSLVLDFTNDIELVSTMISSLISVSCQPSFDFVNLFNGLNEWYGPRFASPKAFKDSSIRIVILYGRSFGMPILSEPNQSLLQHPCCYFDVLYVHKKLVKGNPENLICQDAYDFFLDTFESESDTKTEFVVEVSGSLSRLQQHMAMLLAHPVLRDDQDTFIDKLNKDT